MAAKGSKKMNGSNLYSFDAGNGSAKGVSSARKETIKFAPLIAPVTDKKALSADEEKPGFSLKVDGKVFVYGVDDVFKHGKRNGMRRLNSEERYTSPDYFNILNVLYLQAFAAYRGNSEYLSPVGVISVPIKQFNDDGVTGEIRATLTGKHTLEDYEGCTLRLQVEHGSVTVLPESAGAMTHYAFDPDTLRKRPDSPTAGTTLVIDIGYETTDISVFEGMSYQRDLAFTIPKAGMSIVAQALYDFCNIKLRGIDISRIDQAMHRLAGMKPGHKKDLEPTPGIFVDVAEVYDNEMATLANRIADSIRTQYTGTPVRALLAGGGAYHHRHALKDMLPFDVVMSPDPDDANVLGGMTYLRLKQQAAR
jgi:hypothetical protein